MLEREREREREREGRANFGSTVVVCGGTKSRGIIITAAAAVERGEGGREGREKKRRETKRSEFAFLVFQSLLRECSLLRATSFPFGAEKSGGHRGSTQTEG